MEGISKLSAYHKEERPWGGFERFTHNEQSTVKIITIIQGESVSLQTHAKREEFWRILSGTGTVTVGDTQYPARAGDTFFVPTGSKHRAEGGEGGLVFLEIAFGEFDEGDIIRLEDRYGRA